MLSLAYDKDEEHMAWAAVRLGMSGRWLEPTHTIGIERDGETVCVVLFNTFVEKNACAHIVSDGFSRWASRPILAGLFAYPFIQCDLHRLTVPVPSSKRNVQIMALKLGFEFEGRLRNAYASGDDDVLFGMQRDDCPWLRYLPKEPRNG